MVPARPLSACVSGRGIGMRARATTELYEDDFYAWTPLQAGALRRFARTRPNLPLDLGHGADPGSRRRVIAWAPRRRPAA